MSGGRRALLGFVVVLGAGLAWAALGGIPRRTPPATVPDGNPPAGAPPPQGVSSPVARTSADCAKCHADVYAEWQSSMHRQAWVDPVVRAFSNDFRMVECLSCHVPQPIHLSPVGERVYERSSGFEDGVDCLSCHLLPDGRVAASRDLPDAPCRPKKVATLADPVSCRGCHNQHGLYDEWLNTFSKPAPEHPDPALRAVLREGRPESCVDCHMPPVDRAPGGGTRAGRSHASLGGHSADLVKRSVTVAARVEGPRVVVETTNTGTGHRVPADARHRSVNVWATLLNEEGQDRGPRTELAEYRMYYRTDPRPYTNLRPGETGRATFDLPEGMKGNVRVEVSYALSPDHKERGDVVVIHLAEVPFDTTK